MCSIISDFFKEEDIDLILQLEEVQIAKSKISHSFYIDLPAHLQTRIYEKLGISLSKVPMKWIKGDTKPHIDKSTTNFKQTHLIYITDSDGYFLIEDQSYSIQKNTAFSFNEGISHETIQTGDIPRLLLGPMSEQGIPVGAPIEPTLISYPGGTIVYIADIEGTIQYTTDYDVWYGINFPCTINNSDTESGVLIIKFISDMALYSNDNYFICNSDYIQFGSTSLNDDGSRPIITVYNVSDYPGLIQNGTESSDGNEYIYIFNLYVKSIDSTLYASEGPGSGWIGHQYFGRNSLNNFIINCSSDGSINSLCGGILGPYSGQDSTGYIEVIGCSSSGDINSYGGGIIGSNSSNINCKSCWTTGTINGGGIFGNNCNSVIADYCYSTGDISESGSGGIVGANSGTTSNVYINHCYTTGYINGTNSGGIAGSYCDYIDIYNCYTSGNVTGTSSGAICGLHNSSNNIKITYCYTHGTVDNNGYFNGVDSNNYTVSLSNVYSEAQSGTPGSWNKTNVNTVLQGTPSSIIGEHWIETVTDLQFELSNMGYTPYTTEIIKFIDFTPILLNTYPYTTITTGDTPEKDMGIDMYDSQFNPNEYQSQLFPDLIDFIDSNIVQGDKTEENKLNASYWNDLGDDIFDDWGYFYIYDVTTSKYYFPLLSPLNQRDGVITTQTFTAFERTFTIQHGWSTIGVFKIDITVNDELPFRFGVYGAMGSDNNQLTQDNTYTYSINNVSKTLYYRYDIESGDEREKLYSYFIPTNSSDNTSKPYSVYYDDGNMSMYTNSITSGITIYFSKGKDVITYIVNNTHNLDSDFEYHTIAPSETSLSAIISDKSYQILKKELITTTNNQNTYTEVDESSITIHSTTGIISTTNLTPLGTYKLYIRNNGSYHITNILLSIESNSNVPICFPAGTPVITDQGEISIEKIDPKKHTIRSNPIVAITQTVPLYEYIVCIEKDSLGKNLPSRRTFISKDHKVLYQGKMTEAEYLPKIIKVKYNKKPLYNVLLKDYAIMEVNHLIVETLHPENPLAKIYTGKYTPQQKRHLVSVMNKKNIEQRKSQIIKSNFLQIIHR
jgi:hypothetical protein